MKAGRGAQDAPGKEGVGLSHSVTVKLGRFAAKALAKPGSGANVGNGGRATAEGVLRAVRFYLNERDAHGPGWAYPEFLRGEQGPNLELELDVDIDESLWRALEVEAGRQRVSVAQLLEHAALYYAAELDAGRVTKRILEDLGDE